MKTTIQTSDNSIKKILIIGLSRSFHETILSIISDSIECEVVILPYSDDFIEKVTSYKPNLIILTTHRYFHLTNAIKSHPQTSKIPIFILSTSASIEEFKKDEANDYLSKPIDVFKFVNKIENLIK